MTALLNNNWRRALAAAIIGLFCFSTETVLRFVSLRVSLSSSMFRRPYLLNAKGGIESVLVILMLISMIPLVPLIIIGLKRQSANHRQVPDENHLESMARIHTEFRQELEDWETLPIERRLDEDIFAHEARLELLRSRMASYLDSTVAQSSKSTRQDSQAMKSIAWVSVAFLPATFVSTLFSMSFFGDTAVGEHLDSSQRLLFFISETQVSVWELDQLLALVSGLLTLAFRIRQSIKSLRK